MLRWLHNFLTRFLDGEDFKRRDKLVKRKSRALSIFDDMRCQLEEVANNLDNESLECDKIIEAKKEEISTQEKNAKDARDERDRISTTCDKLAELLGDDAKKEYNG